MPSIAFAMQLLPGCAAAYARRHAALWPELARTLIAHGVRNYAIFLDPASGRLFAHAEIDALDRWQAIAATEVCPRWWTCMQPLMETNPDRSPRTISLVEVFRFPPACRETSAPTSGVDRDGSPEAAGPAFGLTT